MSRLMARSRGASATEADRPRQVGQVEDAGSERVLELRGVRLQAGLEELRHCAETGRSPRRSRPRGQRPRAARGSSLGHEGRVSGRGPGPRERFASRCPRELLRSALMAYVPSDREGRGSASPASMRENILALRRREFRRAGLDRQEAPRRGGPRSGRGFGLRADPKSTAASLSGGNRQRLLLARELDRPEAALDPRRAPSEP